MHETLPSDPLDAAALRIAHELLIADLKGEGLPSGPTIERHLNSTAVIAAYLTAEFRHVRSLPKVDRDRMLMELLSK
jgi:hypothetical protein